MKPRDVKKYNDLLNMKRDNWSYGDFTIGFNTHKELYIHEQKMGEECKQRFIIPKKVFNHFMKVFSIDS